MIDGSILTDWLWLQAKRSELDAMEATISASLASLQVNLSTLGFGEEASAMRT